MKIVDDPFVKIKYTQMKRQVKIIVGIVEIGIHQILKGHHGILYLTFKLYKIISKKEEVLSCML